MKLMKPPFKDFQVMKFNEVHYMFLSQQDTKNRQDRIRVAVRPWKLALEAHSCHATKQLCCVQKRKPMKHSGQMIAAQQ